MNILLSMIPVSELRVAIPLGIAKGLNPWAVYITAVLGNLVPVPFLMLLARKIFDWLRGRSEWMDRLLNRVDWRIQAKAKKVNRYERLGLLIFVAIPLPGTGAWSGALIASFLDLRIRNAMISIFGGLLVAGLIMTMITLGVVSF